MLRFLVGLSLQYRAMILAGAAALIVFAGVQLRDARVDVLPEFSPPVIQIQTEALGLSAAEVEDLVTLNLEEILTSVSWLKSIRSTSMTGLSVIALTFEPGTEIYRARQLVQERLNLARALPNVSKPPYMLQPLSTTSRAMIVGLIAKDVSLVDASVLTRWAIVPKLLGVPGVANVAVWGMRSRQLQVQVDSERLRDRGVNLQQVVRSAGDAMWTSPLTFLEASNPSAGGWIDTPNQRLGIQHVQPITSPEQLAQVAVADVVDKALRLGDVARVVEEHPLLIGDAIVKGGPGLLLVIERFPGSNPAEVVRGVNGALDELRQGLPGIELDSTIYQATSFLDLSLSNLAKGVLLGSVLVILVLCATFLRARAVLIGIIVIPLSLLTAAFVLYLRGTTFDVVMLSGFAVALAALIDDAVRDIDNIMRRLRQHRNEGRDRSAALVIFEACLETRGVMIYATLILMLAVTPLFLLVGPLHAFLSPFVVGYALALLASMAVALMVIPALAMVLLRTQAGGSEPAVMRWLADRHAAILMRSVRAPRAAFLIIGIVIAASLAALPMLRWSLLPSFKERDIVISWQGPISTSLPEMRRVMGQVTQELQRIPGLRNVVVHIGRAVTGDQVVGIESAQHWLTVDRKADYAATLAAIREAVEAYPGFNGEVRTYRTDLTKGLTLRAAAPLVVRVQGLEREVLQREAQTVAKMVSEIPGIRNARVEVRPEAPQIEIKVNLAAAARVGLKPGDVRRAAATVFAGLEVGNLYEQQKIFEVVVWGTPDIRRSFTDIENLQIDSPTGGYVRLADLADVRIVPTPAVIEREGVSRRVEIHADVQGGNASAIARQVRERLQKHEFPLEYHAVVIETQREQQTAFWQAILGTLAAAIGIYLLFQACFRSWRLASVLLLTVVAAVLGSSLAVLATGGTVLLGSLAGCVAVLGVAVRGGISLVAHYQSLEREQREAFGPGLVLLGTREQLGPMVTSAAAVIAALLPITALGPIAGLELLQPLAVVVVWGVSVSTILNLFAVPALYLRFATAQPKFDRPEVDRSERYA